ncbi:NAD-dependent epimerase/dehydratase family protein [Vibrio europaeus]|uniref:Epimerase n=1 Tax=Vibrio europaeus TaxID=300876 RepID=A0A178JHE0_9VIBR|nr:NAD(P)-dependent oxidoreductase [Vibrio europaeus]MDC5704572.1 NAD(P)-dependent oxidoreductase [Vibrio europaeus]MDC5712076.1 NAD(P)-dependent oxidoreductase [Vibrio europaeus]MDC5717804.1 NAD(P)-dependent oxidoreductase [Vibrio europaeus]MDC5727695.1 NAD(P)-dependent oxidoreductase [Vibrio europaeus]MDC5731904.1 NAD(P)-dependent oxidoreductase [Vibrio europaeus]
MRVLVTGSGGRIGRNIYIHLMSQFHVEGLDIQPCSTVDHLGDIRDSNLLRVALRGVDIVVHTAALHAPHVGNRTEDEFFDINVYATEVIANIAAEQGVSHIIFTSTTALYGSASTPNGKASWITESTTPLPKTIYHKSKIEAEHRLEKISKNIGLPITVLQISRCFPEPADMMAIYRLNRGIDARDVASAHVCAIKARLSGFNRYIISADSPFHTNDCEQLYLQADKVITKHAPDLAQEFTTRGWCLPTSLDRVYDSSLAQKELNWIPKYNYREVCAQLDACIAEVLPTSNTSMRAW